MALLCIAPILVVKRLSAIANAAAMRPTKVSLICLCGEVKQLTSKEFDSSSLSASRAGAQRVLNCGRTEWFGVAFCTATTRSNLGEQGVLTSQTINLDSRRLILYSKPGCCLCDALKEKLQSGGTFADILLEVRDITTNSDWWNAYQYEIPVLARLTEAGTEHMYEFKHVMWMIRGVQELLPRLSPRLTAEQLQKKVASLMTPVS